MVVADFGEDPGAGPQLDPWLTSNNVSRIVELLSADRQFTLGGAFMADAYPIVGVVMGSDSDWPVMQEASQVLDEFGIAYEAEVISAHRMPHEMIAYGQSAAERGLRVIIAGAGGAVHLPGMLASVSLLPIIGVPVPLRYLDGLDSLLSVVQMPAGVPVAVVSIAGARNAGLLAVRILAVRDVALQSQLERFQSSLNATARAKGAKLHNTRTNVPEGITTE